MWSTMVNRNVLIIHFVLKPSTQPCDMAWLDSAGHCCMNGDVLQHCRAELPAELWCSSSTAITVTVSSSTWQEAAWTERHLLGTAASKECAGQCGWERGRRTGCWDLSFSEAVTCLPSSAAHPSKASALLPGQFSNLPHNFLFPSLLKKGKEKILKFMYIYFNGSLN